MDEGQYLLTKNTITVDDEDISDSKVFSQLYQKPNVKTLGIPVALHIYNLADQESDSTYQKWLHKNPNREDRLIRLLSQKQVEKLGRSYVAFNKWLQESGDAPVIIEQEKIEKSVERLKEYYYSFGWFNREVDYVVDRTDNKRASISYQVRLHQPYVIDSISETISSPIVDSLFQQTKHLTFIKRGNQYSSNDFENERERLTLQFRNSGLYYFEQDYINFIGDTVNTGHKANITYIIPDRSYKVGDSTKTEPFKVHHISEVRVITDYSFANIGKPLTDSISIGEYKLYSYEKLKYRPKAITDAIAIIPGTTFKDIDRTITYNQIRDLGIFKYPNISYQVDPRDSTGTGLITTILLTARKKYNFQTDFDTYISTIQQLGIGFSSSFLIRNVFRGAETLQLSARGSIGASKDAADGSSNTFFNISDVGGDVKLTFRRILFPIKTEKWIPKYMSPSTTMSIGFNAQNNIGLDRQNINAAFNYEWRPSNIRSNKLELINVQYVKNLNTINYFNVYKNSFTTLNDIAQENETANPNSINPEYYSVDSNNELVLNIPEGADGFIDDALAGNITGINLNSNNFTTISNIDERKLRLTEDNLIFATSFTWSRDTRENISDASFSRFRWKVESAGTLLRGISQAANLKENEAGNFDILGVNYSQYLKFETEYNKHWDLGHNTIFAIRTFAGVAIPYGNSNSIPFTRSYFAGGANDNRGWKPYDLGPGSSGSQNEFNEANLKIALNAEYRYPILGSVKGAFFIDAGNIWNASDNVEDPASKFEDLSDLRELAIATGIGLRYDFGFFVVRFDIGFKTYDPARVEGARWFKDYNFGKAVYNIGINYPF